MEFEKMPNGLIIPKDQVVDNGKGYIEFEEIKNSEHPAVKETLQKMEHAGFREGERVTIRRGNQDIESDWAVFVDRTKGGIYIERKGYGQKPITLEDLITLNPDGSSKEFSFTREGQFAKVERSNGTCEDGWQIFVDTDSGFLKAIKGNQLKKPITLDQLKKWNS